MWLAADEWARMIVQSEVAMDRLGEAQRALSHVLDETQWNSIAGRAFQETVRNLAVEAQSLSWLIADQRNDAVPLQARSEERAREHAAERADALEVERIARIGTRHGAL
ncbi:hypothetical protein [Zhihengliuella sp.]|uniref:hypothetical protein n=1 Tax=Zhihengliuella sp. TaxID=1954483 RepID=UPI002810D6AE|nr:hypothetical protein [Zhihengliuella sp.]